MKKLLFLVIFFVLLAFPIKANAAICTGAAFDLVEKDAYGIKVTHELKFRDDLWNEPYYEVTVSNLTKNVQLVYGAAIYTYGMDKNHPDSFVLHDGARIDSTIELAVYPADNTPCMGYKVYTIKHTLPYYNVFINTDECAAYPDFPLCAKDYKGGATADDFLAELEKYIDELNKKPAEPEPEVKEKDNFEKIIDFYMNNKMITIPLTVIVVLSIVILIVHYVLKSKKRAKYRIEI